MDNAQGHENQDSWHRLHRSLLAPPVVSRCSARRLLRRHCQLDGQRAELCSRTFWTFAREFPPFTAHGAIVRQRA